MMNENDENETTGSTWRRFGRFRSIGAQDNNRRVGFKRIRRLASSISHRRLKYPRLFHFIVGVIVPALFLLFWAGVCGAILASMEKGQELESNDKALRLYHITMQRMSKDNVFPRSAVNSCLGESLNETNSFLLACIEQPPPVPNEINDPITRCLGESLNETTSFLLDCIKEPPLAVNVIDDPITRVLANITEDLYNYKLSFHWNKCRNGTDGSDLPLNQSEFYLKQWRESFDEELEKEIRLMRKGNEPITPQMNNTARVRASLNASGKKNCITNYQGGSIFWFTLMTTIGYGNAAPVTDKGRGLVIGLGFFSILGFTAVIGSATSVTQTIADDAFKRLKMPRLVDGWLAALFWCICFVLWTILSAGIGNAYLKHRYGEPLRFFDAYWFCFISMTTVGFGDYYIPHEQFMYVDLFYIPFLLLYGFVLFSLFLFKLSRALFETMRRYGLLGSNRASLEQILSITRNEMMGPDTLIAAPTLGHGDIKIEVANNDDKDVEEMQMQVNKQQPAFPVKIQSESVSIKE